VLDPARVVATLVQLRSRIDERFPESGLARVGGDLVVTGEDTARRARNLARPYLGLQALVAGVVVTAVAIQVFVLKQIDWSPVWHRSDVLAITQGLDAAVNLTVLSAGAIWFLAGLERRWKRARALRDLYRLRAFAHVIDMHQLTKDPSVVLAGARPTASSPRRRMSEPQLLRYLDYCSELLALISKLAALYAAHTRDVEVISAVNDIEDLTSNLGRKIWQKITILSQLRDAEEPPTLDG
jgi:hypothetical protein